MSDATMRASDADLRAVVAANADGMVVVDRLGTIRYANPAAAELFGVTSEELVERVFGFPVYAGEVEEIGIFRNGQPLTVEMRVTAVSWDGEDG